MKVQPNGRVITSDLVKYYKWDEEMTEKAKQTIAEAELAVKVPQMHENMYNKIEREAKKNWDLFYKVNKTNFYKDRHYIKHEFIELVDRLAKNPEQKFVLLDAGCGVGNGFYPLYQEYSDRLSVNCCDFSPRAVDFVKKNEAYNAEKINANVCDLVNDPALPFPTETAHFGILLFVLSAISPENYPMVAKKIFD